MFYLTKNKLCNRGILYVFTHRQDGFDLLIVRQRLEWAEKPISKKGLLMWFDPTMKAPQARALPTDLDPPPPSN